MNCENCGNEIEDFAICSDCKIELRQAAKRTPIELAAIDLFLVCSKAKKLLNNIERVFYFNYDEVPHSVEEIEQEITQLLNNISIKTPNNQSNPKN